MKRVVSLSLLLFTVLLAWGQTDYGKKLSDAALLLTLDHVKYDPSYYRIAYPMGDVPAGRGVCTDVVIRAYRRLNVDLQQEVHRDMKAYFNLYPKKWGMTKTDTNIDHRRVLNLMTFFERHGESLAVTQQASDYLPGDIVCWYLDAKGTTHIGIVVDKRSSDGKRYKVVHNVGGGQNCDDVLFAYYKIIGHYRYVK